MKFNFLFMVFNVNSIIKLININLTSFNNNSLLIRYALTVCVFYSHMFAIYGLQEPTLLWGNHSLGWYAVNGFFFISGLLVAQSFVKRDLKSYLKARTLRILPAYIVSLIITLFLVVIFGNGNIKSSISLLFNNLLPIYNLSLSMSGTWQNSSIPSDLNASLWTIPFEVFCYLFITPLLLLNIKVLIKIYLFFIALYFLLKLGILNGSEFRLDLLRVLIYFCLGVKFYLILNNKKITISIIFLIFILFFFEGNIKETLMGYTIILLILLFGFYFKAIFKSKNDYSYGIYLYAWPISQLVRELGVENIYAGLSIAFIILMVVSYLSWTYLEKPFLNMKNINK